jgi:hypothetical protein
MRLMLSLALVTALASCASEPPQPRPEPRERAVSRLIGDWLQALDAGDYERAATFFAPGAIVDQGRPIRLPGRAAARFFNATLPCRADLVDVDDEPGPEALASFELRAGPGGPCSGTVQVRFTIRAGRFTAWRQLPQPAEPAGPTV